METTGKRVPFETGTPEIVLGYEYRDSITGAQGIATSATLYINACVRICLQPQEVKDGKPVESSFFDAVALEYVGTGIAKGQPVTPEVDVTVHGGIKLNGGPDRQDGAARQADVGR